MDKVSIILPVYNSEKTIYATIKSVINQTYKNIELIIVNDGSTDKTEMICKDLYLKNQNTIKYIYKKNSGVSDARNTGISYATGKYVMFIDSDDMFDEEMVYKMINKINSNDYHLITCGYIRKNITGEKIVRKNVNEIYSFDRQNLKQYIEVLQKNNLFNQLWNKIYVLDIIKKNNIKFDKTLSLAEDLKFNLQYINTIKNVGFLSETLYYYINNNTGLNLKYRKDRFESNFKVYLLQEKIYKENKFETSYLDNLYLKIYLSGLKNIGLNNDKVEKKELITLLKKNTYENTIKIIHRTKVKKVKIILCILIKLNITLTKIISKILVFIDKYYKRYKLGY